MKEKLKATGKQFDISNDKFYTKDNVAFELLKNLKLDEFDYIVEPSAGKGAFSKQLDSYNLDAYDLFPESPEIKRGNWFDQVIPSKYKNVLIVGNPPFGKANKLSKSFLKHAFSFDNVTTVAFILPEVYRKHTLQRCIPKEFKITSIVDIPINSFTISGETHHVPCSFFIFEKNSTKKDLRQKPDIKTSDFSFDRENYDFFVFGASPKKIIENPNQNNRGYYIKSHIGRDALIKRFKAIKWRGYSSANGGIYWLTSVDIIENYNRSKNIFKQMGI